MVLKIYSDASYCMDLKIAACGFVLLIDGKMLAHEVSLFSEMPHSSSAEFHAAFLALQKANEMFGYIEETVLYIDNQGIKKMNQNQYIPKCSSGISLKKIITLYKDNCHLQIVHVKAHQNIKKESTNRMYNGLVDRASRKALREKRKELHQFKI